MNGPHPPSQVRLPAEDQRCFSQVAACLAALQCSVDLLRQPLLSELQLAGLHRDIDNQTARLNALLQQVLTAGGAEAGQPVQLLNWLEPMLADYRRLSPARQFGLRLEGQPNTAVFALPGVLLVFKLLLDNALRRTPGGGAIEITGAVEPDGSGWNFNIHDEGAGLSPMQLDMLFDNPSRVGATSVYGLGLSLANCMVAALGGRLWAASAPGQGATFGFTLPPLAKLRRWTVLRPKVLLIESEAGLCGALTAEYEAAGFEIVTVASVEAALTLLPDFDPGLVLVEMSPASVAGQTCLQTLRQRSRAAVVFLVAPDERAAVPDALWQGASDCLVKPFHVRELIARTRAILRRQLAAPGRPRQPAYEWPGLRLRPEVTSLLP